MQFSALFCLRYDPYGNKWPPFCWCFITASMCCASDTHVAIRLHSFTAFHCQLASSCFTTWYERDIFIVRSEADKRQVNLPDVTLSCPPVHQPSFKSIRQMMCPWYEKQTERQNDRDYSICSMSTVEVLAKRSCLHCWHLHQMHI